WGNHIYVRGKDNDLGLLYQASLWSISYPIFYLVASLLSFNTTTLSTILYILIPLFYLFPSVIDQQLGTLSNEF
ncbi:MAG: hypothetical protein ACMG55_15625, partial [Microcoleus sp.]